jgi:hypothetical protein
MSLYHLLLRPLVSTVGSPEANEEWHYKLTLGVCRTRGNELRLRASLYGAGRRLEVSRSVPEAELRAHTSGEAEALSTLLEGLVAGMVRDLLRPRKPPNRV